MTRDYMVEPGGIVSSSDGKLWRVLKVDNEKVAVADLRGWKRIEVKWKEWAKGWVLRFP